MVQPNESRPYDLLVFGVGFTGLLVAEYLATNYAKTVKFAIGGRNRQKLEAAKKKLVGIDPACESVGVLIADSFDPDALEAAVKQTKAVVSTVGPYAEYGIELVGACVRAGTHYADITGETPFVQRYIAKYNEEAKRKGVLLVSMCGFDSIPSDLGTLMVSDYIRKNYKQSVANVKMSVMAAKGGASGGTVQSLLGIFKLPLKQQKSAFLDPYALNPSGVRGPQKFDSMLPVHYDRDFGKWQAPFVMAPINRLVVRRSNALHNNELYGPKFRYNETMSCPNVVLAILVAVFTAVGAFVLWPLMQISFTSKIVQNLLPGSGKGPTQEQIETGHFTVELIAESDAPAGGPKHRVKGVVKGKRDPGYGETSKMLAESGLALALDRQSLPGTGGAMTPATAMGQVLIGRLRKAGMTFEVKDM